MGFGGALAGLPGLVVVRVVGVGRLVGWGGWRVDSVGCDGEGHVGVGGGGGRGGGLVGWGGRGEGGSWGSGADAGFVFSVEI